MTDELQTITNFKNELRKQLKHQLEYYDFNITGPCNNWIESVIDFFVDSAEWENQPIDLIMQEIVDNTDEMVEESNFEWPTETEAAAIVSKALRNDSSHFEYITEMTGFSMSPADCFKAEWFWKGSIRPDILKWIENYTEEEY